MQMVRVQHTTKNRVLRDRVGVIETSLSRIVRLLGKKSLGPGTRIVIFPSQAVNTVGMRPPIDVLFVDRNCRVVHVEPALAPLSDQRVPLECALRP